MKTTMKKALSLILTVAMLLSVAVVATVSPSATTGENLFVAYQEYYSKSWSGSVQNQCSGIKLDAIYSTLGELNPATTDIATGVEIGRVFFEGLSLPMMFGASYSGATGSIDGENKAYSLHLLIYNRSTATITEVDFTIGGTTFIYYKDTANTGILYKAGSGWDNSTKVTTWKDRNTFVEIEIPLSSLSLKQVYDETAPSTNMTITAKTSAGDQTLDGRLVLETKRCPTVEAAGYGVSELDANAQAALATDLIAHSATPNYVPAIKFYQTSAVVGEGEDAKYNVRLIATVNKALVDAGNMTVAGFNVAASASKTNGEGTVNGTTKAHKVYEVYTSITASGETVNAPEGTYFMVFTIKGIAADDVLTLNFSAFAETETAQYVEGNVFTLSFQNGERKN